MNPDEYFPDDLDVIIGKKVLLKIFYSEYNHNRNTHKYRCDAVSEDLDVIAYFKNGFMESDVCKHTFLTFMLFACYYRYVTTFIFFLLY